MMRNINPMLVILLALLVFALALAFCPMSMRMSSAQEISPDKTPVRCEYSDYTWDDWPDCPVRVITATPLPYPTPTIEYAPTATPTNTPTPEQPTCYATVLAEEGLNVRDQPGGVKIGGLAYLQVIIIKSYIDYQGDRWYEHIFEEWIGYSSGGHDDDVYLNLYGDCTHLIEEPAPTAEGLLVKRGIHFTTGGSCDLFLVNADDYGIAKGITGNENCINRIAVERPDIFLIWRNWERPGYGYGDGPPGWGTGDPVAIATDWFMAEYYMWQSKGLLNTVDLFEIVNELPYKGEWEIQFWLRSLELANAKGICLGVFSDGYGNPTLLQFAERAPVLNYMVEHECQPGRHHMIAAHQYSRYDSGPWYFDRWQLQRDFWRGLYGPKYDGLQWVFTEFGLPNTRGDYDGRGLADCVRGLGELVTIDRVFGEHPEVAGYTIFGMGALPLWFDWSICLS